VPAAASTFVMPTDGRNRRSAVHTCTFTQHFTSSTRAWIDYSPEIATNIGRNEELIATSSSMASVSCVVLRRAPARSSIPVSEEGRGRRLTIGYVVVVVVGECNLDCNLTRTTIARLCLPHLSAFPLLLIWRFVSVTDASSSAHKDPPRSFGEHHTATEKFAHSEAGEGRGTILVVEESRVVNVMTMRWLVWC